MALIVRLCRRISTLSPCQMRLISTTSVGLSKGSVDPNEVGFFSSDENVQNWWTEASVLATMNEIRVPFIRDGLLNSKDTETKDRVSKQRSLEGLSIIDVGCGAGILSEPLSRLGASVTGIDVSESMVEAAEVHAEFDPLLKGRITFTCSSIEELQDTHAESFDAVVASEVLEHVTDVDGFVNSCATIAKPGGSLFFTTINKTLPAYIIAILAAEGSRMVLPGTHQYNKFVPTERLHSALVNCGCKVQSIKGTMINPLNARWRWFGSTQVFYAVHAIKTS